MRDTDCTRPTIQWGTGRNCKKP